MKQSFTKWPRLFMLNPRRVSLYLGTPAIACLLIQIALGASLWVVLLATISVVAGLASLFITGVYTTATWLALFYVLGNVLIALYAKTLMGQPLDSYLYAPVDSFLALAVTSSSLLFALLLVRQIGVGRPLFESVSNPRFLAFLSWSCFGLGILFSLLNRWFQNPSGEGFGGIALFRDLLLMSVIARTAMLLERSGDRRAFDGRLGLIMAISVFLGLIDNSKAAAALPVASHFATVFFYRRGLPVRTVVAVAIGVMVFVSLVAPMIHGLRALGQQELSLEQRIGFVASNVIELLEAPQEFDRFEQLAAEQFQHGYYYSYFGDGGTGQMLLGRYASVQQVDPVIARVDQEGPRGGAAVWPALARLLPSFIYPEKPEYTEAFNTLVYYGLVDPSGGKFPTLPLAGQAYAAYGLLGLFTIPFITFFGFLLVLKKLGWQLYRNIYAIFFFCSFVLVYANQGDFGQYAGAALRNFPLFAIVFWLIALSYRVRLRRPRPSARLVRGEQRRVLSYMSGGRR